MAQQDDVESRCSSIRIQDPQAPIPLGTGDIMKWVISHHRENLVMRLEEPKKGIFAINKQPAEEQIRFRISFAELQRIRLRQLQCELVEDAIYMHQNATNLPGWEVRLEKYSKLQPPSLVPT